MTIALLQDIFQIMIWIVGLILIGLILLQGGAGDVSSAFGGGGQLDGALGVGANRKLAKITGWLAFFFLLMIVVLAMPRGDFRSEAVGIDDGRHPDLEEPAERGFSIDPQTMDAVPEETAPVEEPASSGLLLDDLDDDAPEPSPDAADTAPEEAAEDATSSGLSFGDEVVAEETEEAEVVVEEETP